MMRPIFIHIPKTGGTWVKQAMANAGSVPVYLGESYHAVLADVAHIPEVVGYSFAFVRHPARWLESLWAFREEIYDGIPVGWIDLPHEKDFDKFIQEYLDNHGGYISAMFTTFTANVDFIGKQKSLADDLVTALTNAGEPFDEAKLRATGPIGESQHTPTCSKEQETAIELAESVAMNRWGL